MRRIFLAGALAALSFTGAAQAVEPDLLSSKYGERRAYFSDVLAACRPDGFCSVNSYEGADGQWTTYQLRVGSPEPGADYEVSMIAVDWFVGDESRMEIAVDGERVASLAPGDDLGWYTEGSINDYRIGQSTANLTLLPAMLKGRQMAVVYRDPDGVIRGPQFSLRGLRGALRWIEDNRFR